MAMLVVTWVVLTLLRLFDGTNIMDDDQERPAMYIQDILVNGNWLAQHDSDGDMMSKPPLYAWLGVLASKFTGGLNEISLYSVGALAVLGTALLVFFQGRRLGNEVAGFVGGAALLLSNPSIKMVHLARTDGLFMVLVFASALAALEAYRGRLNWFWFWVLSALSTLTKGPIGIILVAGGFIATFLAQDSTREPNMRRTAIGHCAGIFFFAVVVGGWFYAAYLQAGDPLIDKIIGKELVGHATESARGDGIGSKIHQPPIYFLSRFLPWSIFAVMAFWRAFKDRGSRTREAFARVFLTCYFLFGLLIFSLSPHQRFDHQFPIIPAAALLAGMEIVRLLGPARIPLLLKAYPAIALLMLGGVKAYHFMNVTKEERRSLLVKRAAKEIPAGIELTYADSLMGLQFFRGTMQIHRNANEVCSLLASDAPVYVAVRRGETWEDIRDCYDGPAYKVAEWIPEKEKEPFLTIYSNRESFPASAEH